MAELSNGDVPSCICAHTLPKKKKKLLHVQLTSEIIIKNQSVMINFVILKTMEHALLHVFDIC